MTAHLTAGFDGSAPSLHAVRWAAEEAARRGTALDVVTCYAPPVMFNPLYAIIPDDIDAIRAATVADLERVVASTALAHPTLHTDARASIGRAVEELVNESKASELMVLGTTGAGAIEALLLGSVARAMVRASACPVVLVPNVDLDPDRGRIVVGIDGSAAAEAALTWAIEEAALRAAELVLVHGWQYAYGPDKEGRDLTEVDAAIVLEQALERTRDDFAGPVRSELIESSPADAVLQIARTSDLIVVGNRGRGALRSILFGSVAHSIAERSTKPIVIVQARKADG